MNNISYTIYLTNGKSLMIYDSSMCSFGQLPNFKISHIEINILGNKTIVIEGFEKYLIIQTDYHVIQGGKGKVFDTLNILGKQKDEVYQLSYHRKGKIFQCKNKWGKEWRPLILKTYPMINKKKQFKIEHSEAQSTKSELWHNGLWMPQAKIYVKEDK